MCGTNILALTQAEERAIYLQRFTGASFYVASWEEAEWMFEFSHCIKALSIELTA